MKKTLLITTYHSRDKIISNNWDPDRSESTRPLMEYRIIRGYRRPRNDRDTLIVAETANPWDVQVANNPRNHRMTLTTGPVKVKAVSTVTK